MERDDNMTTLYPDFSTLTTKELLAITLRESCTSEIVDELSQHFTLRELTEATMSELSEVKGMGKRKATALLASIELAKRLSCGIPASDVKIIHSHLGIARQAQRTSRLQIS
jgi:DNA repair protein RadC